MLNLLMCNVQKKEVYLIIATFSGVLHNRV